jgi:very-short-patch-repair endonuclease
VHFSVGNTAWITLAQWCDLGFTRAALNRAVDRGDFVRVLPRVYRSTLVPASLHEAGLGAVLWAGAGSLASHLTAARIFGAELPRSKPHILMPPSRSVTSKLVVVHRGVVASRDHWLRDGVPLTSPARTLVDIAGMLDEETLQTVMEDFFHRGLTTPMSTARCLDAVGGKGRPGSHLLRALLEDRDQAPLEKKLEVKIWRLLRGAGFRPVRQHWFTVNGERYRLDFAFPRLKVGVEGHGFGAHGGRLAHVDDARRLSDLVGAGWRIVPVTWEAATQDPERVVQSVRNALLEAAA